jgi:uncharacterized protein (DUF58 family)
MPVMTRLGTIWAAGSVALLLLALLLRSNLALTLASASVLGLVLDAVLTFPLAPPARRAGLELSWWISGTEERPPAVVSAKIPIEGHLRLQTRAHLRLVSIAPVVDDALDVEVITRPVELRDAAPSRFRLTVRPKAVGRHVLQGLSTLASGPFGAFAVGLYFPHPLEVRALPRSLTVSPRRADAAAYERLEGSSRRSESGSGTDLHELRAHRPGDSLKQVAWKASARRGRLLVREVEHEVQETHWLIVDLGSSMFAGAPGARRIDRAIEAASSLARRSLDDGHRVGLATFDARLLDVIAPADGNRQRIALLEKLSDAVDVYDAARIDADDRALAAFVADHLREHEARFHPVTSERDRALLAAILAPQLRDLLPSDTPPPPSDVLLAYCKKHGLRLPSRAIPPDGARAQALSAAVLRVLEGGPPSSLHVFSDLDEIPIESKAVATLRLAGVRGRLRLHIPEASASTSRDPLTRALAQTFSRAEAQKHRRLVQALERPAAPRRIA